MTTIKGNVLADNQPGTLADIALLYMHTNQFIISYWHVCVITGY